MKENICTATIYDVIAITDMAKILWPTSDYEGLRMEFADIISSDKEDVLLYLDNDKCVAFMHIALRNDYVEGSSGSPTGYIEGVFVKPEFRGQGIAKALLKKGEAWCKALGCNQLASDVDIHNDTSIDFHKSIGFSEVNRIVCFIKELP